METAIGVHPNGCVPAYQFKQEHPFKVNEKT
jgi:hypothetical protein